MNDKDSMPCPYCHEPISGGAALCRHCDRGLDSKLFSPCMFCGEMIRQTATRCRFCQGRLADGTQSQGLVERKEPSTGVQADDTSNVGDTASENARAENAPAENIRPREGGLPGVFDSVHPSNKQAKDASDKKGINAFSASSSYGAGVRAQVFEVIVRQAMAGAPWREICAGPMLINNITPEEIEQEVAKRRLLGSYESASHRETETPSPSVPNNLQFAKLIQRLLRIADDIAKNDRNGSLAPLIEDLRVLARELGAAWLGPPDGLRRSAAEINFKQEMETELQGFAAKYDAMLDLLNGRDKVIRERNEEIENLNKQVEERDQKVKELDKQLEDLKNELEELKKRFDL